MGKFCYIFTLLSVMKLGVINKQKNISMDILKIIFAIILPPVGVFLEVGITGAFWLNILLTILGYIPGIIHAIWIIAQK